jgi:uncharacterized protein (DUF849 family)
MGSLNFALYPAVSRIKEFKHDWEKDYLQFTEDFIFSNTFKNMKYNLNFMRTHNTLPELEIYDVGMINNVSQLIREGELKKPIYIQFVMGILGGIPATVPNLVTLYNTAKEQLREFEWSVCAAGKDQLKVTTAALTLGGNVRVGLEDSLYAGKGVMAKSSAEQVEKIKQVAEILSIEIATPDEARQILGLKGMDKEKIINN